MKINNLKINGFGKLENKEISLDNNINLIYGENEAGKTTLLKFITGMFYGVAKNKNKKEFPDYERYKPWGDKEFSGKIKYTLDNNNQYEVYRDFTKKNPQIYNENGEDISKTFSIDKTKGNDFFYEQTKIEESTFLSTTLVEQKTVDLDSSQQAVLTQKIANILSTGEENISYKKTMEKLNKKSIEEVGTERTVGRPLNIISEKLNRLNREKENSDENLKIKDELENKKINIQNKIEEKEIKLNLIKEIKKIKENSNIENEKIKVNYNLKEEEVKKIEKIEDDIQKNNNENKKYNNIYLIVLGVLLIINILLFIFKINNIIKYSILGGTVIYGIIIIINKIRINNKIKETNKTNKKYLAEINLIKNNVNKIQKNINQIESTKKENENTQKNKIKEKYSAQIDEEELNYLFKINMDNINTELEELEKDISSLKLQLYTNNVDYNNAIKKIEEKAKMEEEIEALKEEKEEILKLDNTINIAKEALGKAYKRMKEEITPKFTKNLSKIAEKISNKYNKVKYIDGEGLIVELENGEYINSNKLSIGTIDQLYLSLRLSAMEEITEEKMPIILDEVFAYYDNKRLKNILKYLNENYKKNQIIIFTCSNREKEILEKEKIAFNYINLHN